MKKQYSIPQIEVLEIGMEGSLMLTASDGQTTEESLARDIIFIDMIDGI
jgi:hypothetical protein